MTLDNTNGMTILLQTNKTNNSMKSKKIFVIVAFIFTLMLTGCGGGGNDDPVKPAPGVLTLSSPADNTACLKSSSSGLTASVVLSWSIASNADSYQIEIKNLNTQTTTTYSTNSLSYTASLAVNTPYSWNVVAVNTIGKATSPVWKFYLSGTAASNYAPFPADLTTPALDAIVNANGASAVQVTFQWTGSDPDNDIASYTFYLDNINASTVAVASQTASVLTQNLSSNKTYYWKVLTTDKVGNTSTSAVSSFQVK